METTDWILLAVGVAALVALLFVVVPAVTLRLVARSLLPRIAARTRPGEVLLQDLKANSLGQTSRGVTQARGNGGLVLTPSELLFFQALPPRELSIPLGQITEVKTVRSQLGKTYFRDLLFVAFRTESGPDSVAWYVRDLAAWLSALSARVNTPQPH